MTTSSSRSPLPLPDDFALAQDTTALFLDFDGTLVEIADHPAHAVLDARTHTALAELHRLLNGALAVISGRDLRNLDARLQPLRPALAGSHGLQRRSASGHFSNLSNTAHDDLDHAVEQLAVLARRENLLLEEKPGSLSLHFRNRPELEMQCRTTIDRLAEKSDALRVIHGNMVAELALRGSDKGKALAAFMTETPFRDRMPVMVGDDTTDEDAFQAAEMLGGFGIRIGQVRTLARYYVPSTSQFLNWLHTQAERD